MEMAPNATIGIVVTTDGSIGELPRENYVEDITSMAIMES